MIPELTLAGLPRERGRQHGEVLRGLIAGAFEAWFEHLAPRTDPARLVAEITNGSGLQAAAPRDRHQIGIRGSQNWGDGWEFSLNSGMRVMSLRSASSGPIDIAPMADTDHLYYQAGVDDLIQDPVVTDAHPVHGLLTCESDAARGPRLVGQQIYCCSNPVLLLARQPRDGLDCPAGDLDGVPAHSSPSAALTSSQGT